MAHRDPPKEPPSGDEGRHLAREASQILETPRPTPLQILAQGALVALLLLVIFGVLIPKVADYGEVWDAITSLSITGIVLMIALTMAIEVAKAAAPSVLIDDLRFGQAFLAQEAAAVVSNTIPGPSGAVTRYAIDRRFGIEFVDFSRATVLVGVWSNLIPLLLPTLAIPLLAAEETVPRRVIILTVAALGISVTVIVIGGLILRSEHFARRFGELTGRFVNWLRGLANRPPSATIGEAVVRFRFDALDAARRRGVRLTLIILAKEFSTFLALLVAVRSLGVGRVDLSAIEIFAAYTLVRVLTLIELTPGNVGVADALYISFLSWATPTSDDHLVVAAVFVFRLFTYLGPIIVGGGCWLILRRRFARHPVDARRTAEP